MAGFGIKSSKDFSVVNSIVGGVILGSAFVKHLSAIGTSAEPINRFVSGLKYK